jgi:hypothetical protein
LYGNRSSSCGAHYELNSFLGGTKKMAVGERKGKEKMAAPKKMGCKETI